MPLPEPDVLPAEVARASRARPLFAAFSHRLGNTGVEMVAVVAVLGLLSSEVSLLLPSVAPPLLVAPLFVLYFAGFWASRFCATPLQMAGRLKVVDYSGQPLTPWRALLRSLALVVLVGAATSLAATFRNPTLWLLAGPACALLLMAVVTRRRQAAHDLLVGSVVVYRRALEAPGGVERLAEAVSSSDAEPPRGSWLWAGWLLRDGLTVLIPVALVYTVAGLQFDRDLMVRVSFAVRQTSELKEAVQQFYREFDRLPSNAQEMGLSKTRTPYPDGGYYVPGEAGRIDIHFSVLPELTRGRLILTPVTDAGRLTWECSQEGSIARKHLPGNCRD